MLIEAISAQAKSHPDRVAYENRTETLTYRALWDKASALAGALTKESGPVMVLGEKEAELPVAFLACLLAGRPYLPADPGQPIARLERIRQVAGAHTVLCCGDYPAVLGGVRPRDLLQHSVSAPLPPRNDDPDAYWIFTSGSTGEPKGVRISLRALEHFVRWMLSLPAVAGCTQGVVVNTARFSFDLSIADLWPTFAAGGTLRALEPAEQSDLSTLFAALARSGAERMTCTPTFARLCLCDPAFCRDLLPTLKTIFLCGEVLPPRTAAMLRQRFAGLRVINAYGPTEATCAVCAVEVTGVDEPLPVGETATAASRLLVLGPDGVPQPDGCRGEIAISGQSVGRGYVGAPAGGFGVLDDAPLYRTGDEGIIRNGLLWYLGRLDRQIKYKGYRIEPGEIEAALFSWPEVRAAAVLPLRRAGEVLGLAAVIEWQGLPLSPTACKDRLREALPAYFVPRRWCTVDQMPVNFRGKCDFQMLERMLRNGTL